MAELGETVDPAALVPGVPSVVAEQARHFAERAGRLETTGDGLATTRADSWQGEASDRFHDSLLDGARRWRETADTSHGAAEAIAAHGEVLAAAQWQAAEAIRIYEEGEQQTRAALAAHADTVADATLTNARNAASGVPARATVPSFVDSGEELRVQAREVLQRARQQVVESGDTTVSQLNGFNPVAVPERSGGADTELAKIEKFMFEEMQNNSKSTTVAAIDKLNLIGKLRPITWVLTSAIPQVPRETVAALAIWAEKVRPGGDWDHKRDILTMTAGNKYTPAPDLGGEIRYDVWSNIHYGYVGREAGFSGDVLHAGADVADLAARRQTDPADQLAVQIGIELHEKYGPEALRPEHIDEALREHREELLRTGAVRPR